MINCTIRDFWVFICLKGIQTKARGTTVNRVLASTDVMFLDVLVNGKSTSSPFTNMF